MRLKSVNTLPNMWEETYELVAQVPKGRVTTYGAVARALGDIVASRFVGLAMSKNEDIVRVPCRRVVQSDGYVGGYTGGGPEKKARLLRREGLEVSGHMIKNLSDVLFTEFDTDHPLAGLRKRQRSLKRHLSTRRSKGIEAVVGIDIAYNGDHAFVAAVRFDPETGSEVGRSVSRGEAEFPYIPTYLAFREIPLLRSAIDFLEPNDVVMYDGNGILHPEGFGIASQIGVVFDIPTIGVAKKLLCGSVSRQVTKGVREIVSNNRVMGYAISKDSRTKPSYVSVGHRVSPDQAIELAERLLQYRVPEPTRAAHIVAESARRAQNQK
ncbi:MAG TPA: endonuclease V [Thermoplasmata archaeon]